MVDDRIDIRILTMEELAGVVGIYPWYAGAQVELCARMKAIDALGEDQLSRAALHVGSRRVLFDIVHGAPGALSAGRDAALPAMRASAMSAAQSSPRSSEPQASGDAAPAYTRKVFVVGGDYFSQSQYNGVRRSDDNIFSSFAAKAGDAGSGQAASASGAAASGISAASGAADSTSWEQEDFCTETLAQIYAEQGYPVEAKAIYSKLMLRYPEKSVYFAALIEKLNETI